MTDVVSTHLQCRRLTFNSCIQKKKSPGEKNGNPLQYPCLENSMDWGECVQSWDHYFLLTFECYNIFELITVSQFCQLLSCVWLFTSPWTAARQASLFITNSWNLLKFMSITLVMPSNHLILCRPLLLLPSIFPSIRVFSNESVLHIRRPEYRSFSYSISPSNEYSGLISFRMDWLDLLAV